jgi:hypothetical protein
MTSPSSQRTDFTLDVTGRYVCNGLDEANRSTDRSVDPDAKPFDYIVVGGGSFGSVFASHILNLDHTRSHRILVLEAGPFLFPEHVQNLPPPLDTNEVWGVPWNSDSPKSWNREFPGLAFCLGGRSLFWGGWSPYLIDSEITSPPWPATVRRDLMTAVLPTGTPTQSYLDHAADQIGTSETNDFVEGPLHEELETILFNGLRARSATADPKLKGKLGTLAVAKDLEAPIAVQSKGERAGFFPFNKFNGVQLLIRAARLAQSEAEQSVVGGPDQRNVKKRLMVVPHTHVIRLERSGGRITRIVTNQGNVDVPFQGKVFLALGTIENTRLALETLPNQRGLIGKNLMAHLRSNLTIRIPKSSLSPAVRAIKELAVSALFVKGIHQHTDGTQGHFHLQITASGVGALGLNSEAELFKKIPNIDELDRFNDLTDDFVVITIRGIGEIVGDKTSPDPLNRIILDNLGPRNGFDYQQPRALVRLEGGAANSKNMLLWDVMDQASDEVASIFANGGPIQYLSTQGPSSTSFWQTTPPSLDVRRDKLSSTHHESGTCWMGDDPNTSVTDDLGRFHESDNLYVLGPCLLPTMGSPNPMLSGVALSRRSGDRLVATASPNPLEDTYQYLFDGTDTLFSKWQLAGGGAFALVDGLIIAQPDQAGELGLLYFPKQFNDFNLRLEFRLNDPANDNSGVFLRFRDPRMPVPGRDGVSRPYNNQHWVAVDTGFEIQIDEAAKPSGLDKNHTAAVYDIPTDPGGIVFQSYRRAAPLRAGAWNEMEIEVVGQTYVVRLNGTETTRFDNVDTFRGKPASVDLQSGFIGLQAHTGRVAFRNVRVSTTVPRPFLEPDKLVAVRSTRGPKLEKVKA